MADNFFFTEIVPTCGKPETSGKIMLEVEKAVSKNTRNDAMRYKIVGEHKIIFIGMNDEPGKVMAEIDKRVGRSVTITTIPIRPYETFAEKILGVDPALCKPIFHAFANPQKLYFSYATVEQPGIGMDDFRVTWKEEALGVLIPRSKGELDFREFKVVANRSVYIFVNLSSAEDMDDISYNLAFAKNPQTANGLLFPTVREVTQF